jgi:hypothetical protein
MLKIFNSTVQEEVKLKVCVGFEKYNQFSKAASFSGIDPSNLVGVVDHIARSAGLPDDDDLKTILMGVKYSETEFTWTGESITYTAADGKSHFFYLTKHANPETKKVDLVYGMVSTEFTLAPDMLIVTRRTSIAGGIFESEKTTFSTIPHELTVSDMQLLEMYFETVVYRKISMITGMPPPQLPDLSPLCPNTMYM